MTLQYFSIQQVIPLVVSMVILLLSLVVFYRNNRIGVSLLFLGSLGLGVFMANLDPFLILWDEQYHALVAKNMVMHPFKPMLFIEPVLDYNYKDWTANHIWLHKQPLFLWQIALSIKLFGNSAFAVRVPSILMHAIISLLIYRIGSLILNKKVGYYGGFFFALAYFPLELIVGRYATDHNDIAFLFYVTASFWGWFEYKKSNSKYWLVIIGISSGFAVLVKWLMGLVVYVIWFLTKLISDKTNRFKILSYKNIAISFLISFMVFIPWQIYILSAFPNEANYEYSLNSKHFFEAVEGHSETLWYYFTDGFNKLYGSAAVIPFLFILGIGMLVAKSSKRVYGYFVVISIVFVYLFYTVAATKMVAFPIIVAPFMFLALSALIWLSLNYFETRINNKIVTNLISIVLVFSVGLMILNINKIQGYHTMWKPHDNHKRDLELYEMEAIKLISNLGSDYVVFNFNITDNGHIPAMYFTDNIVYGIIPTPEQLNQTLDKSKKVAVVNNGKLPDYILNDGRIKIVTFPKRTSIISPKSSSNTLNLSR